MFLTPAEIASATVENGIKKTSLPIWKMILLGIMAGAFIAFAAEGSNMAASHLLSQPETFGLGKLVAGVIFPAGLILVVICGAELFTGNSLILMSVLSKKATVGGLLKNWVFVYIGNLIGSVLIAFFIAKSGQLSASSAELAGMTIKIAEGKVALPFGSAVILGILCNWLVCAAVWMATGAKDITGKIFAIFFPIMLFIVSGFEHSVANMYYIPAGIFAKAVPAYAEAALALGVTEEQMASLNWGALFGSNLLPVTIGNVIGGAVFMGMIYWFVYLRKSEKK